MTKGLQNKYYKNVITATIAAQNSFSSSLFFKGDFNFSLSGTWAGTVFLQRSFDDLTWLDVESFTENTEKIGNEPEGAYYRAGIKTGGYTSGDAVIRISQDTNA